MVLANVIAFAVLKILHNVLSFKSLCLQITAEVSQIKNRVLCDLTFIFIELSETAYSFLKIRLALEIKNVASFTKTRFY